jgi:TRAP-type C4-dicarboxylate transport system permease small subunit
MNAADTPTPGLLGRLSSGTLVLGGLALLGIAAVQLWQVFARYVLNDTPGWTEPWTMTLLSAAMSFSAASAVQAHAHFSFPLLSAAAPAALRRLMQSFSHAVVAVIGALLCVWSAQLLVEGVDVRMAGTALPESAPFAPLCIGGALMTLFALNHLWGTLRKEAN